MATLRLTYDDGSVNVWTFPDADQFDIGDSIWKIMEAKGIPYPEPHSAGFYGDDQ